MTRALLVLALATPGFVFGQAMTEYATAAAGSTAGAAAGKKINPALTSVLGKLDTATKKAADQGATKKPLVQAGETKEVSKKPVEAVPVARKPAPAARPVTAASRPAVPHDSPAYNPGVPEPPNSRAYSWAPVAPPAVRPRPVQATPETFAQVAAGSSRADVIKSLGNPASKISMVEDGKLIESYRYRDLGTVRLANGSVTTVVKN